MGSQTKVYGLIILGVLLVGCARPNVYKNWDQSLRTMSEANPARGVFHTLDDVSMLVGTPPDSCTTSVAAQPKLGVSIDETTNAVVGVQPGSAAADAGLRAGDQIISVDGVPTPTSTELFRELRARAVSENVAIQIVTSAQSSFSITPRVPQLEQCYWSISGGEIGKSRAALSWGGGGGGAGASSANYSRFYRLTCRFQDGSLSSFRSNWQF